MVSPICIPFLSFFLFSLFSKAKKNHRHDPVCITRSMGEKRKLYFYISRRLDCSQDFVKNKFSLSLKFFSHEKNWDKKNWSIWQNFNYWLIKMTKTQISPNFYVPNGFFVCITKSYHSRIEVCQNCSAVFVSVLLMSGKSEGASEFLFQKIWACVSTRHRGEL